MGVRRVLQYLILEKIAEAETIEVSDSEVEDEVEKMVKEDEKEAENIRKFFSLPQTRESIKQFLTTKKTLGRLVQIASGSD